MAEQINIKIVVDSAGTNQSVGQLKNNLEGVNNAQKNVVNSGTQLNTNLRNTSTNIRGIPLANAVRGVDRLGSSFANMKLGGIASGFSMLSRAVAVTPWGAAAVAVGAVAYKMGAFDGVIKKVTKEYNKFMKQFEDYREMQDKGIAGYAKEKVGLDELFNSLSNVNIKGGERSKVIEEINKKYGEYLPKLLDEQSTNEDIALAYDLVNEALVKKAVTQAKANALEVATTQLLKDRIEAQKALSKAEREAAKGISSTEQLNRVKKAVEDAKQEILDIDAAYQEEVKKINKVAQDLEASLFTATAKNAEELEKKKKAREEKRRKEEEARKLKAQQEAYKKTLDAQEKAQEEAFKLTQDRYEKEKKIIIDENITQQNLLKKQFSEAKITEEKFEEEKLKLNITVNEKLLAQNSAFKITDEENKKMGAKKELDFLKIISDDKLKYNGSYYDGLIALAKSNEEKMKAQKEKEAQEEKLRKEAELAEEKRIYEQSLNSFENEFILKKREIQLNDDLTEEERKNKLEEAELEFLRNKLSITELGGEEYFKLIEEITEKEIELNKNKNKKIEDDNKKRQEELKAGFEAAINVGNQALGAFSALADAQLEIRTKGLEKGSVEEQKAAKRDFETRKKISIASAVISGIEGLVNIWTAKSTIPQPFDAIYRGVQTAFLVGTTAANIAKIKASTFQGSTPPTQEAPPSGGGGGAATTETPTFQPTQFFGLGQTVAGMSPEAGGPTRVYVTEGDISNTQNRVRVVENRARFG